MTESLMSIEPTIEFFNKFKYDIFKEVVDTVEATLRDDNQVVDFFRILDSNLILWSHVEECIYPLNRAMDYFLSIEEYEICSKIVVLIDDVKTIRERTVEVIH